MSENSDGVLSSRSLYSYEQWWNRHTAIGGGHQAVACRTLDEALENVTPGAIAKHLFPAVLVFDRLNLI